MPAAWESYQVTEHLPGHAQAIPLYQKAGAGLTAGGLGALVGSPADLSLIRMQSDATLPVERRRNYKVRSQSLAGAASAAKQRGSPPEPSSTAGTMIWQA